ncbi:3-isopropylmalate dehydrogenase [Jeotgalicoccus saudimassiliensis]|uniref:3-isopropylmalate dehydrogenase n=1 Tax=Jeotgalicoccus saudimassiliensis TaxID=1461582 RepID=A0A078LZ66_9STAP|nr:3-isopropylmalate dehydrogenase [Jeotgalicoccus saudimassiliensis]CDZ99339.1 3-isopropylmalate dehydrogenase [Jeotgalicoccus saudimassiliensis]
MKKHIITLPGDGIGPEIMNSAHELLKAVGEKYNHEFTVESKDIGGIAIDKHNDPLPAETIEACESADAILLGAVGGPKWADSKIRPEQGLLKIRKQFNLFANLRPVTIFDSLEASSPLKQHVVRGSDLMIVRELTGGLYFGQPSERRDGGQSVVDTLTYTYGEIERIVRTAFDTAMSRRKHLTSVDKANVLESSRMWREIVNKVSSEYPEVTVEHELVDAAAMKLITNPSYFDVIVTENLFGDILSDEASVITGSLGVLPSASLSDKGLGLFEPIHGSAPDIAGENKANPIGMMLSVGMMLKYSFGLHEESAAIEKAVNQVLADGFKTGDLQIDRAVTLSTTEMTEKIISVL